MTLRSGVSTRERWAYGLGDMASNFVFATVTQFLMFFYTDVYGLAAATAGTLLLIARFWDAAWDVTVGILVDRTHTRWGRCRPYLFLGAPLLAIAVIATFTIPPFGPRGKTLYALVSYTLAMSAFSLVAIPYSSLPALMTDDPDERMRVSGTRLLLGIGGMVLTGSLTLPLVEFFGGGNQARGYQLTTAAMGVFGMVLFWICASQVRERALVAPQPLRLAFESRFLLRSRAWWTIFLASMVLFIAWFEPGATTLYYFTYVVKQPDRASLFFFIGGIGMLCGVWLADRLARTADKYYIFIITTGLSVPVYLLFYVVDVGNPLQLYSLDFVSQALNTMCVPILWSMIADVADDLELRSARQMVGLTTSSLVFAQKIGTGFSGAVAGSILAWYHYSPGHEQTQQTIHGVKMTMSVVPALGFGLATLLMLAYPLRQRVLDSQRDQLRLARQGAPS